MGEELDKPIKEYNPKNNENMYLKYGLNQVQGWKKTMEDYTLDCLESSEEQLLNIFGIFDGHGGKEVPRYLSSHFYEFLKKNENFKNGKYKEALRETFFEVDKSFTTEEVQKELTKYSEELKPSKEQEINNINNLCGPGEKLNQDELEQIMAFNEVFDPRNIENANIAEFTGATGIIIFICDKNIYIANAGNSRCLVIDKDGAIINKTKDHTMNDPDEKKRVELARSFNEEEEKKKAENDVQTEFLDSTRGFGDWEFKGNEWIDQKDQEISVEPDIIEVPLKDAQYLIMGSHGMFEDNDNGGDVNSDVSKFFVDEIKNNSGKPYSDMIKEYFEKIIAKEKSEDKIVKGLDNMSCIVISLIPEKIAEFIKNRDIKAEEKKKKEAEEKKKKKEEEQNKKKEEEEKKKKEEEEKKKKEEEDKKKKEEEEKKENENKIEEPKIEEVKKAEEDKKEEEPKKEEEKKEDEAKKEEEKKDEDNKNVIIEEKKPEEIKEEKKEEVPVKEEEKKEEIKEEEKKE